MGCIVADWFAPSRGVYKPRLSERLIPHSREVAQLCGEVTCDFGCNFPEIG